MSQSSTAEEVFLSNRRKTGSKNEPFSSVDAFWGVDRLSLSAPVRHYERDVTAWSNIQVARPGTDNAARRWGGTVSTKDDVNVFVGVQEIPETNTTWCKIEFNPSRILDPDGFGLAHADAVHSAVDLAIEAAEQLLEPAVGSLGEMKIKRLDVARDFHGVERPAFLVRGLGPVHRPWARRNLVHFDPGKNGAQTLMVGSGSGVVRLYDKDAETGGKAPGVLRWEAECRRDWVTKYGDMPTLGDLDARNVEILGMNRWHWSKMGTEVRPLDAVIEQVMRSELSFAEQRGLLGYLTMLAAGADVRAAKATHAKFRKAAREMGITLDPDTLRGGESSFSARLDVETGRMIKNG